MKFNLVILFIICFASLSQGDEIASPIISFSFDRSNSSLNVESGKAELAADGLKGSALKVGDPEQVISWKLSNSSFTWEKGTISFWFKPLDWKNQGQFRHWLHILSPATKNINSPDFVLLNFVDGYTCFQLNDSGGSPGFHAWCNNNYWENDQWYFVTCTWDSQRQAVYLNGELDEGVGTYDISTSLNITEKTFAGGKLYIGTKIKSWKGYPTIETTLMDELEIRDTRLTDEQVRQLYFEQKPASEKAEELANVKSIRDTALGYPDRPRLTVPLAASAPKIDGRVNEDEWSDASRFVGLVDIGTGFLSEKDFTGYIKSDGEKLYIAFDRTVRSIEFLKIDQSGRDSDVYYDDSWELYLYPNDGTEEWYQAVVNSTGAIFDWYKGEVKWNGNWEIKQYLERPGLWQMELAIPLAELGVKDVSDGENFMFGFFFNQFTPEKMSLGWTTQIGLYQKKSLAAVLDFSKDKPIVRLNSLGKPTLGLVAPVITGSGGASDTKITVEFPNGRKMEKIVKSESHGKPVQFKSLKGKGFAKLSVTSPANASADKADFHYSTILKYDSVPLTVKTTNYPSRKEVQLDINYMAMDSPESVKKYKIDFGSYSEVLKRKAKLPWEVFSVSTSKLKPGKYKANIMLLDAEGKELITQQLDYTMEGNETWLGTSVGIEKGFVPAPFTPMTVKGRRVGIVDRKIELDKTGLPKQIVSKGIELLSEPIRISGEFNGKTSIMESSKSFKFQNISADDSSGYADVKLGPWKGKLKQTISFDGFAWYDLELFSAKKVSTKNVALEMRLPRDVAKNYILSNTDFKSSKIEEWDMWGPLTKDLSLGVTPQAWLGNTTAGIAWIMENHKGWQVVDESRIIDILIEEDTVLLRANIVDKAIDMTGEFKIAFGIQSSPVRPVTDRQQQNIIGSGRSVEYPPEAEIYWVYMGQDTTKPERVVAYAGLPEAANPELSKKDAERIKDSAYYAPYSEFTWLSMGLDEMKIYGGDWSLNDVWGGTAGSAADPKPFALVDTENKDYQDFIVWRFIQGWEDYGGHTVYYDLMCPFQNKFKSYTTRSGETAYHWPIRGVREIARRLYIAYRKKNPDFAIFGHASTMYLPITGFADGWPNGEYFVFVTNSYPEVLTYERYQAFLLGYPLGFKTYFLPSMKTPALIRTDMTHYLTGLVYNHNTDYWLSFCDQSAVHPYMKTYHSGRWAIQEFMPYWDNPNLTDLDPEKFKVSGWYNKKEKKGLLCIALLSKDEVTVPISLGADWKHANTGKLTDACKESLIGWDTTYPSGKTARVGDYAFYLGAGKMGAVFNEKNKTAEFKPLGVLMLHVK